MYGQLMKNSSYDIFSRYYDTIMETTDYDYWKKIIHSYCARNLIIPPESILEIGTGTGNLQLLLSKTGYHVVGIDSSQKMLEVAAGKLPSNSNLVRGRMENLCFRPGSFRCAVALFEVLNYLESLADLESFFRQLTYVLTEDFIIFADFITEKKIESFFHRGTFSHLVSENVSTVWKCDFDEEKKCAVITTTFKDKQKSGDIRYTEKHFKYIFSAVELENLFLKLDFEIYDVLESFTYKSPDRNSERILYILKGANSG